METSRRSKNLSKIGGGGVGFNAEFHHVLMVISFVYVDEIVNRQIERQGSFVRGKRFNTT